MTPTEQKDYDELMAEADEALQSGDRNHALIMHNRMDDFVADMNEDEERRFDRRMASLSRLAFEST